MTGTKRLGRLLGFDKESGVYISIAPEAWRCELVDVRGWEAWRMEPEIAIAQLSVGLDSEKLFGWKGRSVWSGTVAIQRVANE